MLLIPAVLPPDAQHALERARRSHASFIPLSVAMAQSRWDLAIDGLFGIGLARPLQGDFRTLAQYLNELDCAVLAVDIPSGLDADHGTVVGATGIAVQADKTLTFIANKPGLYTGSGRDYSGKVELETLGVNSAIYSEPLAHLNLSLIHI